MNAKLKEKLADFIGDEKAVEEFAGEVDERQRQIKDENMIARTKNAEEKDKEKTEGEEMDVETEPVNENTEETIEIELDEELDGEIRKRATEAVAPLLVPINETIATIEKKYEGLINKLTNEIKELRTQVDGIKEIASAVEEIVETETPVGRIRRAYKLGRPSKDNNVVKTEDGEKEYTDVVEMRNERFKNKVQTKS